MVAPGGARRNPNEAKDDTSTLSQDEAAKSIVHDVLKGQAVFVLVSSKNLGKLSDMIDAYIEYLPEPTAETKQLPMGPVEGWSYGDVWSPYQGHLDFYDRLIFTTVSPQNDDYEDPNALGMWVNQTFRRSHPDVWNEIITARAIKQGVPLLFQWLGARGYPHRLSIYRDVAVSRRKCDLLFIDFKMESTKVKSDKDENPIKGNALKLLNAAKAIGEPFKPSDVSKESKSRHPAVKDPLPGVSIGRARDTLIEHGLMTFDPETKTHTLIEQED